MAGIELDAVEALLSTFGPQGRRTAATIPLDDALALVAEVRQLREELGELRTQLLCDVASPVDTERCGHPNHGGWDHACAPFRGEGS